jgi:glutathione S-transferase
MRAMSITFYTAPMSTASVTELVIEELGLHVERVVLDIKAGDTKKPEFLKLNPNGKVPALVVDGTPLFESSAITLYLGETYGVAKTLWPAPGLHRAEAMKWVMWGAVTVTQSAYRYGQNTGPWTPADQQNAKAAEAAKQEIQDHLAILNNALAGKNYLVANEYTLADAHLNSLLTWLRFMKHDFSKYTNVNAWSERCMARPAFKKVNAGAGM